MNGFELRLQMLTLSWNMLQSEYNALKDKDVVFPTLDEVLQRAREMNVFVSEK
jgi:hypothetical protein